MRFDITSITFWPRRSSSFDFMHKYDQINSFGIILEIHNIFSLHNNSSILGVMIKTFTLAWRY